MGLRSIEVVSVPVSDQDQARAFYLGWTNTEFTHHAAEIACLRDLYRSCPLPAPSVVV